MDCRQCGAKVEPEDCFCTNCGMQLNSQSSGIEQVAPELSRPLALGQSSNPEIIGRIKSKSGENMLGVFIAIIFLLLLLGGFQYIYNFIIARNDGNWLILNETTQGQLQKHMNKYSQLTWHSYLVDGYSFDFDNKNKRLIHFGLGLIDIPVNNAEGLLDGVCGYNWRYVFNSGGVWILESSKGAFRCSVEPDNSIQGVDIQAFVNKDCVDGNDLNLGVSCDLN